MTRISPLLWTSRRDFPPSARVDKTPSRRRGCSWGRAAQDPQVSKWSDTSQLGCPRPVDASARDQIRTNETFRCRLNGRHFRSRGDLAIRPELRGTFSRSRRDLAICAFNASNADGSASCRPQIELKLPIRVGVVSRPARAAARYRMRDNEGFRPELRGTFSRSRRDLAICAFNASNANGAAPCRPQIELKLPIQVGVVARRARTRARHRRFQP